jgi:uncharacterized membrane protein YhhN
MFWPVLGITAIALCLVQLGSLTVSVAVLKAMLSAMSAIALALGLALAWVTHRDTPAAS